MLAFASPLFAVLALGARPATGWLIFYLVVLVGLVLLDPIVREAITRRPYELRLIFYASTWISGIVLGFLVAGVGNHVRIFGNR